MTLTATALPASGPEAVRLADWGLIRARGDDAATFLHSQLTQDMTGLSTGQARLAGWCSPKGRLLATFVVWRPAPDEFILACSADLLAATLKRLSLFVLRARCKLSDASAELALWGLHAPAVPGAEAGASWPARAWEVGIGPSGALVRLDDVAGRVRALWAAPLDAAPALPAAGDAGLWNWLEVRSAVPRIVAGTADAFVPQMVNLELVGGVHFQKGCYPGQEVVARSQYRGTIKRRMFLAETSGAAAPGMNVFAPEDPLQPAGQVVLAAACPGAPGRVDALVEAKIALAEAGTLRLGGLDGPALACQPLPYALPAEAA